MSHFSDVMSTYIADKKKVSHEQLGETIESKLEDRKYWKKIELGDGVSSVSFHYCNLPPSRLTALMIIPYCCSVRNGIRRLVLLSHHPIGRELRSQIFSSNERSTPQIRRHSLLSRYPLQVILQQCCSNLHDRSRYGSFVLLLFPSSSRLCD